nr:hypothetical protein [uncultured Duganella sp.]
MATAKSVGRAIGSVAVGIVALPFALAAAVPVSIASIGLANCPHTSRFKRLHKEIGEDLKRIDKIRKEPSNGLREYYDRQVSKYLRPNEQVVESLGIDLKNLIDFFQDPKNDAKWSYTGMESPGKHGLLLFMAFGHATVDGISLGADAGIRIAPKAFCLTDQVLSGVMLHEATHFVLGTRDIAYDTSTWIGHERLKELARGEHYRNADNWRIFYQKMRKKFRP